MTSTTVSKLKASLSMYLAKVKAGEDLVITERGRIIAKIIPARINDQTISPSVYLLERGGRARIGTNRLPRDFWDLPRPGSVKNSWAITALLDERADGR